MVHHKIPRTKLRGIFYCLFLRELPFVHHGGTSHINGIAAITLTTLQYTPQEYKAMAEHADGPQTDKDSEGTDRKSVV